jgi:hypothetical protein
MPGEICIGGAGIAREYLGLPQLSDERFVPDPFGPPGARLYRMGDRGRWREDGTLELLGRLDREVKIRGVRIQPAEVERVIESHPAITEAAVIAVVEASGESSLRAVVVPTGAPPSPAELRAFVAGALPAQMVPSRFMVVEALPRTPTGKIDRRALAALRPDADLTVVRGEEPATPLEVAMASIWHDLIGVKVSRDDNFFDVGGHSLLAVECVARMETELSQRVAPRDLVYQTLRQLAASCEAAGPATTRRSVVRKLTELRAGRRGRGARDLEQ